METDHQDNTSSNGTPMPEQTESVHSEGRENKVFSLIIIGLTAAVVLVTVFGFWPQSPKTQQPTENLPTAASTLGATNEAVEAERRNLPVELMQLTEPGVFEQNQSAASEQIDANASESQRAVHVPESDIDTSPASDSEREDVEAGTVVAGSSGAATNPNSTHPRKDIEPGTVTAGDDDSVEIKTVTVTNLAQTGTPEIITRQGVIRILDAVNDSFVISQQDSSEFYQINITNNTQLWINDKPMSYAQLRRDDIVKVTGTGHDESVKLNADAVTVIGRYKRIPPTIN